MELASVVAVEIAIMEIGLILMVAVLAQKYDLFFEPHFQRLVIIIRLLETKSLRIKFGAISLRRSILCENTQP